MKRSLLKLLTVAAMLGLACTPRLGAEPLFARYGTGTLLHPLQEPESIPYPTCYTQGPCKCCKERVHIFAVNGLNPMCLGNFNGLCCYLRKQGFENIYFGQLYTSHWFCRKIREIRQCDPEARIVLVGFSLGANYVEVMANNLAKDDTRVDLLVYLVGDLIGNTEYSKPPNVTRIVNVRAQGLVLTGGDLFFNGADIDRARNCQLKCRHILVPSRRETVSLMTQELLIEACFPCPPASPAVVLPPLVVPTANAESPVVLPPLTVPVTNRK